MQLIERELRDQLTRPVVFQTVFCVCWCVCVHAYQQKMAGELLVKYLLRQIVPKVLQIELQVQTFAHGEANILMRKNKQQGKKVSLKCIHHY